MGTAVGLLVQANNVHHPDLGHRGGNQADFGADELAVQHGGTTIDERHLDGPVRRDLGVAQGLDLCREPLRQLVDLKVHSA